MTQIKKRLLNIYAIGTIILIVVVGVIFIRSIVSNESEIYQLGSLRENSEVDFHIYNPSYSQVQDLENLDSIDSISSYYMFDLEIEKSNSNFNSNVLMLDEYNDIDKTPYSEQRLIFGRLPSNESETIVDFDLANEQNIKLNDTISFNLGVSGQEFSYQIVGISENNPIKSNTIVVEYTDQLEAAIITIDVFADGIDYTGAFISSNDIEDTWVYLENNYQPLSLLRDRTEFNNDLDYEEYLDQFNSQDYAFNIYRTNDEYNLSLSQRKNINKIMTNDLVFASMFMFFSYLVMSIGSIIYNKKILHKLYIKGSNRSVFTFFLIMFQEISMIVLILAIEFGVLNYLIDDSIYIHNSILTSKRIYIYIIGVISTFLSIFIVNKYNSNIFSKMKKIRK